MKNFRPVSLLNVLVLDKCAEIQLSSYLKPVGENILTKFQLGFISAKNTSDGLFDLTTDPLSNPISVLLSCLAVSSMHLVLLIT